MKKTDYKNETIVCTCDNCGEVYEVSFDVKPDFKACVEELKDEGWVVTKIEDEWHDFCCSECRQEFLDSIKRSKMFVRPKQVVISSIAIKTEDPNALKDLVYPAFCDSWEYKNYLTFKIDNDKAKELLKLLDEKLSKYSCCILRDDSCVISIKNGTSKIRYAKTWDGTPSADVKKEVSQIFDRLESFLIFE